MLMTVLYHALHDALVRSSVVRGARTWCTVWRARKGLPEGMHHTFMAASAINALLLLLAVMALVEPYVSSVHYRFEGAIVVAGLAVLIDVMMWIAMAPKAYLAVLRQTTGGRRWWAQL